MRTYLCETFPSIPYFREHGPVEESASISGVYATCLVAMVYGMRLVYQDNDWPSIHPKDHFSLEDLIGLKPIDIAGTPVGENLLWQIEVIGREWGSCSGYLNYQGVLQNAFKLLGEELFLDMLTEPEETDALLSHVADTMVKLIRMVEDAQRITGFSPVGGGLSTCISNCLANLISPELYDEAVLKHDRYVAGKLTATGVHTCNWVVDKILPALAKIENLGYVDFGIKSGLEDVERLLPEARKLAFYTPSELLTITDEQLYRQLHRLREVFGGCDVCFCDVDVNTPDEQVVRFASMVRRVSEGA